MDAGCGTSFSLPLPFLSLVSAGKIFHCKTNGSCLVLLLFLHLQSHPPFFIPNDHSGYCIFFAQQFAAVVESLGGATLDKLVWIAIFFVILIPFTLIRNIGRLGFSAILADVCIIVGLIYLYVYDIKELIIHQGSPLPLQLFNSQDFGLFIGTGKRLVMSSC